MYTYQYPRPAVTVDIVVFTVRLKGLHVLLIQRREQPFRWKWALPGGFVKLGESIDAAANRELLEETGVEGAYLEQLYTYGDINRDPRGRVISIAYFALLAADTPIQHQTDSDAAQAAWYPFAQLPELAFDHTDIIQYALRRVRYKLEYSAIGFELIPTEFTLTEIQRTYEIVLGETLDKRNFRRRIIEAGIIEPTAHTRTDRGRPARLYRYRPDAVAEIKARRLFP